MQLGSVRFRSFFQSSELDLQTLAASQPMTITQAPAKLSPASTVECNGSVSSLVLNTSYSHPIPLPTPSPNLDQYSLSLLYLHTLMPSKTYHPCPDTQDKQIQTELLPWPGIPMVDSEQHPSSSTFDLTPTLSGSCPSRVPLNQQPSVAPFEPPFPQMCENRSVYTPPSNAIAIRYFCGSTPVHNSKAREPRGLKDNMKAFGIDEQDDWEIEAAVGGAGITEVLCSCSYPAPPTSLQTESTSGLVMEHARTSSPSAASWFTSSTPDIPNSTHNLHQGSTASFPYSFNNAIPQPSTCLFSEG